MKNLVIPSDLSRTLRGCLLLTLGCLAFIVPQRAHGLGRVGPESRESDTVIHRFEVGDGHFMLDGRLWVIKAAELHYPRIPKEYWEHRIKMCKALGMNTICLYVFWNVHEPTPGKFDFTGQNDLAGFISLCRDNGMYVILRPGPYVCAEWEMGGLPWWLLQHKDVSLRESDPYFLERVGLFEDAVAREVGGMTIDKGGPIIMVQVENEYGSYGENKPYVSAIRDMLRRNYGDITMFQCDWSSNFKLNGLDDLVWTLNFGTGADIDREFAPLKEARPDSPLMCSEYWSGWFDKWGANHETRPADDMIAGIDEMLSKDISFSLYMTHGGTNWGHWAGANSPGFAPDVTSYDYDAPISESGRVTPKYHALRDVMARYNGGDSLPTVPSPIPIVAVEPFRMSEFVPLRRMIESVTPHHDDSIHTMETYGQGFGSILYRTTLPVNLGDSIVLTVNAPHDYARVYVDGEYVGKLDRRHDERKLKLPSGISGKRLDILVEAMGRINFGRAIKDFKGITDSVTISDNLRHHNLTGWSVYNLPDEYEFYTRQDYLPIESLKSSSERRPGCYRGSFTVDSVGDTFLDMSRWGKGLVYVNGYPIGRFWEIGPQQTLYMPGCWLREGDNEIVVFDITGPADPVVAGLQEPIIDMLRPDGGQGGYHGKNLDLSGSIPAASGEFRPGGGWQEMGLDTPAKGRFLCVEAVDGFGNDSVASVAEIYLLGTDGKRLSRENWRVVYAGSEDTAGNHTADKAFDLQESTYWSTRAADGGTRAIVIDLGRDETVTGLQYLPRMEAGTPGAIRTYRLYLDSHPFGL
ncbi:MAG: beta-galactosidase [Pseudoflavonifractor sp.]|nr:beta-galactosidase [Pseudoflavonifractor sp.]